MDSTKRPPTRTTIRFPADVHEALALLAERTGVPTQFTVVEAVRAYLAQAEIKAKLKKKRSG